MQSAIPLIQILDDDNFVVNPDAEQILRSIRNPISVITTIGCPHTGKSTLLNFLHSGKCGFKTGDGNAPPSKCTTKGIWMWITNMWVNDQRSKSQDITLITLDCEGIFGQNHEGKNDAKIFALAILFSTVLIYNSLPGLLDDNAITPLSLMNKLPEIVRQLPGSNGTQDFDENVFRKLTPTLCWVLRDFERSLVDSNGLEVTPLQYMEEYLQTKSGYDRKALECTRLRKILTTLFPDRMCKVVARPIFDEISIKHLARCPANMLRHEFNANIEDFQNYIFSNLDTKKYDGKQITGSVFIDFAQRCVTAINQVGYISVQDTWDKISRSECEMLVGQLVRGYGTKVAAVATGVDGEKFDVIHEDAMHEALAAFDKSSVGKYHNEMKNQLRAALMAEKKKFAEVNYQASAGVCESVARDLFLSMISSKLYPDSTSSPYETNAQLLKDDWSKLAEAYNEKAVGTARKDVFSEMTHGRMVEALAAVTKSMRERFENTIKVQQVLMQNLETKLASKIVDEHALRSSSQANASKVELLEARVIELTSSNKEMMLRIDDIEALKGLAERELARARDAKDRLEEKLVDLRAKLLTKSNAYDEAKRQVTDLGVQVQSLQRRFDQEVMEKNSLKSELEVMTEKLQHAESLSFGKSGSGEALDSFTVMQSQINTLKNQLRTLQAEKSQMDIQLRTEKEVLAQNLERLEETSRSKIAELTEEMAYHRAEVASKDKLLSGQEDAIKGLQANIRDLTTRLTTAENVQGTALRNFGARDDAGKENAATKQAMEEILSEHRAIVEEKSKQVMAMAASSEMLKRELIQVQRDLAALADSKRQILEDHQKESDRLTGELAALHQMFEMEKRRTEVVVQTQRANLQSSGTTLHSLETQVAELQHRCAELENKDQVNVLSLDEMGRAKREVEEQLIREKAARQQVEKRLSDGLNSLDSTSRSFQELQYAYETLLSENSAMKNQVEKQKLIAANATAVSEKASADVNEAVRAINGYVAEIDGHLNTIKRLEGVIVEKGREIESLEGVIRQHLNTITDKDQKIESLQNNISDMKAMSMRDSTTTSTLASKIQQLDNQVGELQAEVKRQQAVAEQARSDRAAMQSEMEGEREERILLEQYLANAREKLENKVQEYEKLVREITEKADAVLQSERAEMSLQLRAREESAKAQYDSLHKEFTGLSAVHDELVRNHMELGKQLSATIASRDALHAELNDTKAHLERANKELVTNYEEAIGSLKGTGEELNSRLAQLTADLQTSRQDLQDAKNAARAERLALEEVHREEKAALNAQIAQLEKDNRKLEQHIQMQVLKIEALDQAIAEQKRAIGLLEASLSQRENMIQTRENTIQTRETSIHGLEAKIESLERHKLELIGNVQSLQLKLDDSYAKVRDVERSLERERDSKLRTEERFDELKRSYEDRLEDARVQLLQKQQQFDSKLSEKTAEFEMLRLRSNEDTTHRINELTSQLSAKTDELNICKRDLTSVTTEKNRVEELYRVYRERTEEVSKETSLSFEATSQALVAKVKSLEENVMELSSTLRSKNSHIEDLEAAKKQLEEELAIVTRMRQRADEKIEVQGQRIELLESAKMNLMAEIQQKSIRLDSHEAVRKQLETQVATMAQDMQRMDRTLLEKMNQIEALKKTVASHERLIEESEARLRELEQDSFEMSRSGQLQSNRIVDMENAKRLVEEMLHREVETRTKLETYVTKLEAQVSDLTAKQVQLEEEREREHATLLQRLDEHMQAAGSTIEGKNREFQEMRVLYEGLKKQHAAAMESRQRLQADYQALETERDALEEEMASLTAGFENRGQLITELESKLLNVNPEIQRLARTLEQREQQIEQLDSELQELTAAFDIRGDKLSKAEEQLGRVHSLQDEINRVKAEKEKLQKALEVALGEVDNKDKMLVEVEAALESLTSAYTNLQTEYTDLCADRNHMQNGLNEAQRTIKALKSQIME